MEILESFTKDKSEISKQVLHDILVKYFKDVPDINDMKWNNFPEGFNLKTLDEKYTIEMSEIYKGNLQKLGAGEETTKPNGKEWDLEKVTPITDGEGGVIPVPKGFYYAGGTKDTGFVISDVKDDDLNNTKGGNQFVWIPCSGENGEVKYQQDSSLWRNKYSDKQRMYVKEDDNITEITEDKWVDNCGGNENTKANDKLSADKYGGFFIGRFEAGLPRELYGNEMKYENMTTALGNGRDVTEKQGENLKPVSKKNNPSWSSITQSNAKKVSANMYIESDSVTSQLVDSYAWDTIIEWMQTGKNSIDVLKSTSYGNYTNNPITVPSNGIYALHLYGDGGDGELIATKYSKGIWTRNVVNNQDEKVNESNIDSYIEKYLSWIKWWYPDLPVVDEKNDFNFTSNAYLGRAEIATGAVETTKIKNIYDMAGNLFEWSTEVSTNGRKREENPYAVFRGGCFYDNGDLGFPICSRDGSRSSITTYHYYVGFRVVLYIK